MKIALIDNCSISKELYHQLITWELNFICDLYRDPLEFIAKKKVRYDLIISDFYFEKANLDFFWDYIDNNNLIILTGNSLDREIDCMGVFKKNSIHSKRNIKTLIMMSKPSLKLELLEDEPLVFPQDR